MLRRLSPCESSEAKWPSRSLTEPRDRRRTEWSTAHLMSSGGRQHRLFCGVFFLIVGFAIMYVVFVGGHGGPLLPSLPAPVYERSLRFHRGRQSERILSCKNPPSSAATGAILGILAVITLPTRQQRDRG